MIPRPLDLKALALLLKQNPVVGLIGARQVGKSTLARRLGAQARGEVSTFDLEDTRDRNRLADPMLALGSRRGLVILDEIQHIPGLFASLRVLADRPRRPARFLILGSASPQLLRQSSESLAGRIAYYELGGLRLSDVGTSQSGQLWLRGGFPRSYTARSHSESFAWREGFIRTFLERDLPQLGITISTPALQRFWMMLAHYHGQILNSSELARAFGVSNHTIVRYLDVLTQALVVRQLPAWYENLSKRQVRSPKVYIRDSGLLHALLDLRTFKDLERHPKVGASWEGFAMNEVMEGLRAASVHWYFWATHAAAELDLLAVRGRNRWGFEFKHTSSPSVTKSMRSALADLSLKQLWVIHAGQDSFPLERNVRAVALSDLATEIPKVLRAVTR